VGILATGMAIFKNLTWNRWKLAAKTEKQKQMLAEVKKRDS